MIRGLYTSGWGMKALTRKMDVIANNMANADTNSYKKDTVVYEGFPELLTRRINDYNTLINKNGVIGDMELGSDVSEVHTDFSQGQLVNTKRSLDVALRQQTPDTASFFSVDVKDRDGNYNRYYTRDGSFSINTNNILVTEQGHPVMGKNGQIVLYGDKFSIDSNGTVLQDGIAVDTLDIREFSDLKGLRKIGSNLLKYEGEEEAGQFKGQVMQGFIEKSNVNIVKEMVDMITVARSYETNYKMITFQDGTLEKVVNEVGLVR